MGNYLHISDNFAKFVAWIGGSCKPSDKGKLTPFPRFTFCQHNFNNVSSMLSYEELPEINSERWLSLEDLPGEEWRDIEEAKGSFMISNYGRVKALSRIRANKSSSKVWHEKIRRLGFNKKGYPSISLTVNCKRVLTSSVHRIVAKAFIQNPDNKPQIDHINTIKKDNRVSNLRWVTNAENAFNPITHKKVHEINSRVGVHHKSEETKAILSEMKKGERNPMYGKFGSLHHNSKPVIQLTLDGDFVKEWTCAKEASKIFGFHITDCCRGHRSQCGGYKWKYK